MIDSRAALAEYLNRIGAGEGPLTLKTLGDVQRAHRLAIPFENLDVILGRGVALSPDAIFDKLVTRRRGEYCFEQNALLLQMLRSMGFEARPLLSRVWLRLADGEDTPPRTHTLNLVRIGDSEYVADAGFGGGYSPPMRVANGEEATTRDGARHRIREDAQHGWMLERDAGSGWTAQYSFTLDEVWPADLEAANHWTATRPATRFTKLRIAARALPDGYASISDRTLTISRLGRSEAQQIEDAADYRTVLAETFGIELSGGEVASLGLF